MSEDRITIHSDEEAMQVLFSLIWNEEEIPDGTEISFENWPRVSVRLTGERFHGTMTTGAMAGFLDLQTAINRSYALLRYDNSTQRLTEEEKRQLEIVVSVEKGSSDLEGALTEALVTAAQGIQNMESHHKLIAIVATGLLWAGAIAFKNFFDNRTKVRLKELENQSSAANRQSRIDELKEIRLLTSQETSRLQILTRALDVVPVLKSIERISDDARMSMLKAASKADEALIQGTFMTGPQASELRVGARSSRTTNIISGRFRVLTVDASRADHQRVTLEKVGEPSAVRIDIPFDSDSRKTRELIRAAEWERFEIEAVIEVDLVGDRTEGIAILKAERAEVDIPAN